MSNYLLRRRKLGLGSCRGITQASETDLRFIRNDAALPNDAGWVFRWGCTSNVPAGRIVNESRGIHAVSDKRGFRLALAAAQVSIPETWAAEDFLRRPADQSLYVLRPATHAQGRHLYHGNSEEVCRQIRQRGLEGGYVSRLINKTAEYRVFVCQGRAVWVARKTPGNPNDVAWNVARGGRFDNVAWGDWPLRVVKEAIKAHAVSNLDFSGVDVMTDAEGVPYVLELNSAPSQTSPYRQQCVAKAFDWIVNHNSKDVIPLIQERGGYKKFIHPALTNEAQVL